MSARLLAMRVQLVSSMASDLSVVRSARVSTQGIDSLQSGESEGLINFLMSERHASPFEHNSFTFLIEAPIYLAREFMRHRIASYNEESARYRELKERFYFPEPIRPLKQIGKTSEYKFDSTYDPDLWEFTIQQFEIAYGKAWESYRAMLDRGVAKEVARMVLPVGIYTSWYVTINARSLMNFLSLRTAPNAQWEIQQIAGMMETHFAEQMPITHSAWVKNGRVSI